MSDAPSPKPEAEIDLLRAQLGALSELVALSQEPRALPATPGGQEEELSLLRQQMVDLAALFESAGPIGMPIPAVPPGADREYRLLKDLLAALVQGMEEAPQTGDTAAPSARSAPSPAPGDAVAALESALAQLLAELVSESDQRLRAETEALRARATLRQHGLDSRPTPNLVPIAGRRGTTA